jgi:hypothetical protein
MKKIFKRIFSPDGKNMDLNENKMIEKLILAGGLQVAGINENGELLYQFTSKIKDIDKDIYEDHLNFVNSEVMKLWEAGFVNIDLFAKEPIVTLTAKAFLPDAVTSLTDQQKWSLEEIKRILKEQEI